MAKPIVHLKTYFQKTTLHGFSYISSSQSWAERIFWIFSLLCSFTCCLLLFYELTTKVLTNPIVVQQPDKPIHIKNIPFPAFSFCATEMPENSYERFLSLIKEGVVPYPVKIDYFPDWLVSVNPYGQEKLNFVGAWMRKYRIKSEMVVTAYGWCNVFNVVGYNEMFKDNSTAEYFQVRDNFNIKDLVQKKIPENLKVEPPLSTPSKGLGLEAGVIAVNLFDRHQDLVISPKIKLLIHSPFERPDLHHPTYDLVVKTVYIITITPQLKITDETLLGLDLDERRCYKNDEMDLKVFKTYTTVNCLMECQSEFILRKCGCVPYYLLTNSTKFLCSPSQMADCYQSEMEKFNEQSCKCYPSCEELSYDITMLVKGDSESMYRDSFLGLEATVIANFKDDSFFPQIRRKYFTMIDWFSFVGGILGLFFGFSFLSAFEIIFHIYLSSCGRNRPAADEKDSKRTKKFDKLRNYWNSFMESSSIHGFSYICDAEMKVIERLAWFMSFTLSIISCSFMIVQLRQKLTIDSVSIAPGDKIFNLTQIPFPTVTIANSFFITDDRYDIFSDLQLLFPGQSQDEKNARNRYYDEYLAAFAVFRSRPNEFGTYEHIKDYGHKISSFVKKYWKINPKSLPFMAWRGKFSIPGAMILTSKSMGYSFNIMDAKDMFNAESISSDFLYSHEYYAKGPDLHLSEKFPWHQSYSSSQGLLIMSNNSDFNSNIYFHSSLDFPMNFRDFFANDCQLRMDKSTVVLIDPEIVTSSDDLKSLTVDQRMCYMKGERKLKFFKVYTQRNCQIECLSEMLLKNCSCVPFDMIRGNETKVCEQVDYICVNKVQDEILYAAEQDQCDCLQPCDYITYNFEIVEIKHKPNYNKLERWQITEAIIQNDMKWPIKFDQLKEEEIDRGTVEIRFRDEEFRSIERIRQFTTVDFLSYIGGLLGLFAGISVLSLFEIFYFFTLRLFCEVMMMMRRLKRVGTESSECAGSVKVEHEVTGHYLP